MYKNILIPVLIDDEHNNKASLRVAEKLASAGAKFTILHVMEPVPSFVIAEIPGDILKQKRAEIDDAMSRMSQYLIDSEIKLVSGHAGREIIDYADKTGVDCIVVASHRPEIADYFLGSTAARVVRHAQCSVHVVR